MGISRGQNLLDPPATRIGGVHPIEETRHRPRANGNVLADLDVPRAELSRFNHDSLACVGVFGNQQLRRQHRAEAAMQFDHHGRRGRRVRHPTFVDPSLHSDVRQRLLLKVALLGIGAVVVGSRPLDIDRVRIMPFDEVAVVAVHRTHQVSERARNWLGEAGAKSGRRFRQFQRQVVEPLTHGRRFRYRERFKKPNLFPIVFQHCYMSPNLAGLMSGIFSLNNLHISYAC